MMNIQRKTLEHVSEILKSVDTYPVYNALITAMIDAGIENSIRSKIAEKYQTAMHEQTKKVSDAKCWIDTIITDIK